MRRKFCFTIKSLVFVLAAVLGFLSSPGRASTGSLDLPIFQMSLKELRNIDVRAGTLSNVKLSKIPVSMTVITKEDIAVTPARNIADLIETYVPGATFMAHQSNRIGIRGIISDRNYKILLQVNGVNLNNKSNQGAVLEIQNWDLNDIEKIEIIRGPGSVIYGPGAIAGIINIITKSGSTATGTEVGSEFVSGYNSSGGYVSYGSQSDNEDGRKTYGYLSYRNTSGVKNPDYFRIDGGTGASGYLGKDYNASTPLSRYYQDMLGPQIKAYFDTSFPKDYRFWVRYSSSGMPDMVDGQRRTLYRTDLKPNRFEARRSLAMTLEKKHVFSDSFSLDSSMGYNTEQQLQVMNSDKTRSFKQGIYNYTPDKGNVHFGLAEHELFLKSVGHFKLRNQNEAAAGVIVSRNWLAAPTLFSLDITDKIAGGFSSRLALDGRYLQEIAGDGFSTTSYSFFAEGNFKLNQGLDLRLSGRMDKNDFSSFLFSPRLAIISELNERNTLKLIVQKAVRMNTLLEQYSNSYQGLENHQESLRGYELIYEFMPDSNIVFSLPVYCYDLEPIGWDGAKTVKLGEQKILGLEPEIKYQWQNSKLGISHSFIKQLSWKSAAGFITEGISYADYNVPVGSLTLISQGSSLNNFPEQATKGYITLGKLPHDLVFHTDAEIFWNYQGKKDGLEMYNNAYAATGGNAAMSAVSSKLKQKHFGGSNIKLNCSLSKTFTKDNTKYTWSIQGMNLLGFKRYVYDSGSNQTFPSKFSWVNEPRTFTVTCKVEF